MMCCSVVTCFVGMNCKTNHPPPLSFSLLGKVLCGKECSCERRSGPAARLHLQPVVLRSAAAANSC